MNIGFEFLLLLAVVQGLTEFLPVSSSGHLALCQHFFNMPKCDGATLEVMLHGGTLISVLWFYRERIIKIITGLVKRDKDAWVYSLCIVVACVPAALAYFLLDDFIESNFDKPMLISILMIINGLVLCSLKFAKDGNAKFGFGRSVLTGLAQAVAMLPGISRSGSTITAARWMGVKGADAMEFSFLVSLPVLAGGIVLKFGDMLEASPSPAEWGGLLLSSVVAAAVGLLALKLLKFLDFFGKFWMFGLYCIAVGGISLVAQWLV